MDHFSRTMLFGLVYLCLPLSEASIQVGTSVNMSRTSAALQSRRQLHSQYKNGPVSPRRKLAVGDFAIFNEVFRDMKFPIEINDPIDVGAGIAVMLSNLVCENIDIGDILLTFELPSETSVSFALEAIQIDAECSFDYDYEGPLGLQGSSSGVAATVDNFFNADLLLTQSEAAIPPDGLQVSNCVAGVTVINMDFDGGVVAFVLDLIDPLIRNLIQSKVEDFICEYVSGLQDQALELLGSVSDFLDPFLEPVNSIDPLGPEREYNQTANSTSAKLVNYQEPTGAIAMSVGLLLDQANTLLGSERNDENAPSGTGRDLGVNVLIRDFILDNDRAFEFRTAGRFLNDGILFNGTYDDIANLEVRVDRVKLKGLDTFTRFDPFKEIGAYTLHGSFAWESTAIEVDIYISLGPPDSDEKVEETIRITTRAEELEFSFAAFIGISEKDIGDLNVGDILNSREILACMVSTVEVANITSLVLKVGVIEDPVIEDFKSPGLARVFENGFNGLYALLDEFVLAAIPGLFQTTLRDFVNEEISRLKDGSECNPVESSSEVDLVDFRDLFLSPSDAKSMGGSGTEPYGDIGSLLRTVVDENLIFVNPETSMPKINEELIAPLTGFQSGIDGTLVFNVTLFALNGGLAVGNLDASFILEAYDLRIENMDTVLDPLLLIETTARSPNELDNDIKIGLEDRPVRGSARVLIALQDINNGINVKDELEITLNLVNAQATIAVLAQMLTSKALALPLRELLNIHCWLATFPAPPLDSQGVRLNGHARTLGLAEVMIVVRKLFLNVTCVECTSPGIQELSKLLLTEGAMDATTQDANMLLDYATSLLDGEFIQIFVDRLLAAAPSKCPGNAAYDPNFQGLKFEPFQAVDPPNDSITFLLVVGASIVGAILCFVAISYVVKIFVKHRHKTWLNSLPSEKVFRIYREQKREDEKATYLKEMTSSLFRSKNVPALVRYMIPVVVIGNIGLFLSGHISIGGSVSVFVEFAEEEVVIRDVFTFSVADSAVQLYEAGGWQLALLILLFSGIWPYTKQLITLVAWFLPPHVLAAGKRGSIFVWLDILAKWSSADIFFLIVSLTAFNIAIRSPDMAYFPADFYSVNIMLTPLWGLYANLIAQLLSQLSSHVIIHYHRKVVSESLTQMKQGEGRARSDSSVDETSDNVSAPDKLHRHGFLRPHRGIKEEVTPRGRVNLLMIAATSAVVVLIFAGCSISSFSFEQLGLLGVAVEFGRQTEVATTEFGVFSIAKTLIDQGRFLGTATDQIGLGVIAGLMILTIVIVPVLQVVMLAYQWLGNLTERRRCNVEVFIEILSSWQYVEVYLLAVIISVWQLGPTSEFLINTYCSELKETFSSLVFYGVLSEDDAQCFRLRGSINAGCFVLIIAAFILFFVTNFVTRAVFQYQRDKVREHRLENLPQEPDTMTQRMLETMEVDEVMEKIQPIPVLFTDSYRWLLISSPVLRSSSMYESNLEQLPEQPSVDDVKSEAVTVPVSNATPRRGETNDESDEESSQYSHESSSLT